MPFIEIVLAFLAVPGDLGALYQLRIATDRCIKYYNLYNDCSDMQALYRLCVKERPEQFFKLAKVAKSQGRQGD